MKICFVHPTDIEENNYSITNYIRGIIEYAYLKKDDIIYIGILKKNRIKKRKKNSSIKCRFFTWGKQAEKRLFPITLKYMILLYIFIIKNKNLLKGRIISINQIEWALPFLYPITSNPVVVTIHGFHGVSAFLKRKENITFYGRIKTFIYNHLERLVIKKADKIIVVSQERYNFYILKYPNNCKKFIFIPPFINRQKFFYRKNKKYLREKYELLKNDIVLLYIGRIVKEKNIDLLVKSFKKLNKMKNGKKLKLLLVGNGIFKEKIENIINDEKMENVFLMNEMSHNLMPEIINCANIFILVSSFEGTPISVLEALSCGIPVVASKAGDLPKLIINGVNGYLIDNFSELELMNAINYIIKIKLEPYKCVESAKEYWASNVIPAILKEYFKTFSELNKVNK